MTPQEWASAANKLSRANPGLSHSDVISKMKEAGMHRPAGIKNNGYDSQRRPMFKPKSRSQGQKDRRTNHEKPSTTEAADQLAELKEMQQTMNNMAAHARSIGIDVEDTHLEHFYPSDQADVIGGRGRPGDYTYVNPKSDSDWKTSFEQFNRTHGGSRYRLLPRQQGYRVADTAYADHLGTEELPGMDVDESMDIEQIFTVLPFMIRQDLALKKTKFPGAEQQSPIQTTGGRVVYRPPSLPGFMEQERTPQVTPPQSKYVPPVVMQYSHETYTNGENGKNGDNGHSHSNGSPPKNGGNGGNGNGGLVNGLIDMTREYEPEHKNINDLALLFIGGRVVLQAVGGLITANP